MRKDLRPAGPVTDALRWAFAARAFEQVVAFLRIAVVARILAPHDFGLMGIAALTIAALEALSQPALDAVLVRSQGDRKDLDTAWTLTLLRSLGLATVSFALAPTLARFFSAAELTTVLRVFSVTVLLRGCTNLAAVTAFQKNVQFNRLFILDGVGFLCSAVASIVLAALFRSVWALVLGFAIGELARLVTSYVMYPDRPAVRFSPASARRLLSMGRWFAGSNALVFLATHLDDAIVAKGIGPAALGLYQVAYRISSLPATEITHVLGRVAFPVYAGLRDDLTRLRQEYRQFLHRTAVGALPLTVLLILAPHDVTAVILGSRWADAAPVVQVLAVFGLLRALAGTFGAVIQAVGAPRVLAAVTAAQIITMLVLLVWFLPAFGLVGVAYSVTLAAVVPFVLAGGYCLRMMRWSLREFIGGIRAPVVASVVAGTGIAVVRHLTAEWFPLPRFLLAGGVAGAAFAIVLTYLLRMHRQASDGAQRPGTLIRWGALRHLLRQHSSGLVIDVGGHDGWILSKLSSAGVVVDADAQSVQAANERNIAGIVAQGERLPVRNEVADTVLCLDLVEHVRDDAGLIRECARVLRPGGKLILTTPCRDMQIAPFVNMDEVNAAWGHVRSGYTEADLRRLGQQHGLMMITSSRYFNVLSRWAYSLLYLTQLGRRVPDQWRLAIMGCIAAVEPVLVWGTAEHAVVMERAATR
ncbi:MAG: oligosaccharide flippase family protein [bacterium]